MEDALKVAQALIDAVETFDPIGEFIDSTDTTPEVTGDTVTFNMTKHVDHKIPGHRGGPGGIIPVGMITYKVTIERSYEKFDDR